MVLLFFQDSSVQLGTCQHLLLAAELQSLHQYDNSSQHCMEGKDRLCPQGRRTLLNKIQINFISKKEVKAVPSLGSEVFKTSHTADSF